MDVSISLLDSDLEMFLGRNVTSATCRPYVIPHVAKTESGQNLDTTPPFSVARKTMVHGA